MGLPAFKAPTSDEAKSATTVTDAAPTRSHDEATVSGTGTGPSTRSGSGAGSGAGTNTGAGITREKTAEELEADAVYEERMEEEYAKRDGGA